MNEQMKNDQPLEDGPEGIVSSTPGNQPSESPPTRKFKLTRKNGIGFLGWYLVVGLIYWLLLKLDSQGYVLWIFFWLIFPAQIITLIILFSVRRLRDVGWGMLSAMAVNLLISMIMGMVYNSICFVPFFIPNLD